MAFTLASPSDQNSFLCRLKVSASMLPEDGDAEIAVAEERRVRRLIGVGEHGRRRHRRLVEEGLVGPARRTAHLSQARRRRRRPPHPKTRQPSRSTFPRRQSPPRRAPFRRRRHPRSRPRPERRTSRDHPPRRHQRLLRPGPRRPPGPPQRRTPSCRTRTPSRPAPSRGSRPRVIAYREETRGPAAGRHAPDAPARRLAERNDALRTAAPAAPGSRPLRRRAPRALAPRRKLCSIKIAVRRSRILFGRTGAARARGASATRANARQR